MRYLLTILCTLCLVNATQAAIVINIEETGSDVVATSSGTANLTDLSVSASGMLNDAQMFPAAGLGLFGPDTSEVDFYESLSGPNNFGTGDFSFNAGTGDFLGISNSLYLAVPAGYSSGASLSNNTTWTNTDLATLGIAEGTHTWTWGSGANADSLTITATSVPEPSTYAALAGLAALGLALFRKRRK